MNRHDSPNPNIAEQVATLARLARDRDFVIATAESCTGGWIAQSLTDLAGSSAWFDAGFVTYSNAAKRRVLGVPASLLAPGGPGAVSEEVVRAMIAGALSASAADLAVAVSGIAGPGGGSEDKPVGTVWIAWGMRRNGKASNPARRRAQGKHSSAARPCPHDIEAHCYRFAGNRRQVRQLTVIAALDGLIARARRPKGTCSDLP